MTKLLYLLALAFLVLSSCTPYAPRTFVFSPTPKDSLLALHATLGDYQEKHAKHDAVYLLHENYFDHSGGNNTWNFQQYIKRRYLVLNPHTQWASTFDYTTREHSSISNAFITVTSPDGTVHTYNQDDLHSETSSDGETTWRVAYSGIQKGSIVEENFIITTQTRSLAPLYHSARLQYTLPCDKLKVQYAIPNWWEVQLKQTAPNYTPVLTDSLDEEHSKHILVYQADSITAYKNEPYAPYARTVAPYVSFLLTRVDINTWNYRAPYDWDEFADEVRLYALDNESFWSNDVNTIAEEITAKCSTNVEKLEAIITYLQQNIKVADRQRDDNFSTILEKKKGSEHMITGLAQTMLDRLDIPSDFILIHSAEEGYFDSTFITDRQLYIPALYVELDNTPYVVFPYYKNLPIDIVLAPYQGQPALRVNRSGYNGFMTLPEGKDINTTIDEQYNLTINDEGKITVEEEKTFRGFNAYAVRRQLENLKKEEFDKEIKEMLTYTEGDIRLLSHEVLNQNDIRKPLVLKLKYEIDNLVTVTPEEVIFQTGGLFSPSSSYMKKVDIAERQNPIKVPYNETINKTITLLYPNQWTITTNLQDQQVKTDFGLVSTVYTREANTLHVRQQRTLQKAQAPKERYSELLQVIGEVSNLSVPSIIFSVR